MWPMVERVPAAAGLFWGTVLAWSASELRIMIRNRGGLGENLDEGSRVWVVALLAVGMGGALTLAWVPAGRLPGWPPVIAGLMLAAGGIALRQWSVATLGSFFTTAVEVQEDHVIIDWGPYAWLRHPSYTGALVTVVGVALALGNLIGCAVATAFALAGLVQRIRVEEHALSSHLGKAWVVFARTRKRLIPLVW
jgi:protein-S-isoprenylcysteine O-methyltransferase